MHIDSHRIRPIDFLPRSRSKIVQAVVISCYCWMAVSFMSAWTRGIFPSPRSSTHGDVTINVIKVIVLSPIYESLLLVGVLELVRLARAPEVIQVIAAGLFVSELHSWPWWPKSLLVIPGFCIMAAAYLYWRRSSWKSALGLVVLVHVLSNCVPVLNYVGSRLPRLSTISATIPSGEIVQTSNQALERTASRCAARMKDEL